MSRRWADEAFEEWWKNYPRRVAKIAARKAWDKIRPTPELHATMLATLGWQCRLEQWREVKWIPHPATYLNDGRFLDEPLGVKKAVARYSTDWQCPHVDPCDNRTKCEYATILKRPVRDEQPTT